MTHNVESIKKITKLVLPKSRSKKKKRTEIKRANTKKNKYRNKKVK